MNIVSFEQLGPVSFIMFVTGATEDAINQAREEFHAYLAANKRAQAQQPDYTDEELMMEEREFEQEFSGELLSFEPWGGKKCTL